ncbi:hypothetical protein ACI2L1_03055 [Streptomyces sp. NPDC019531]|uniref:hypothetical protein n=1 Tax=Streptomyces sp. NPDC019531 TaxID=3365062 RepID=UPI00384D3951
MLGVVDGDALDQAVGAYFADRHRGVVEPADTSGPRSVIAVDGKALKGSARLDAPPSSAARGHSLAGLAPGPGRPG